MHDIFSQARTVEATSPPVAQRAAHLAPPRVDGSILVVEVDRAHREHLQGFLHANGILAIAISSQIRAFELVRNGGLFDAVVIEPGSRTSTDMTLLRQIRCLRPDLFVVALLHDDASELRAQACAEGAVYCITGTTPMDEIAAVLRALVERSRASRTPSGRWSAGSGRDKH